MRNDNEFSHTVTLTSGLRHSAVAGPEHPCASVFYFTCDDGLGYNLCLDWQFSPQFDGLLVKNVFESK